MVEAVPRAAQGDEVDAARWWLARRHPVAEGDVSSVVTGGFEAYARILHPASRMGTGSGKRVEVRWAEVAAWSGRRLHPLAQFDSLRASSDCAAAPFDSAPEIGPLPAAQATALVEVLSAFSGGPQPDCWFAVWDGYGWLHPGDWGSYAPLRRRANPRRAIALGHRAQRVMPGAGGWVASGLLTGRWRRPPRRPAADNTGPKVHAEIRAYLLYRGPLSATTVPPADLDDPARVAGAAAGWADLWWPEDRSWMLAGDTDLDSTYLGASQALVDAVVACPGLEALQVRSGDPITADSDALNTS